MIANIYSPKKLATQSGKSKANLWILAFEKGAAKIRDPLMGWSGSLGTDQQIRLTFDSSEAAIAYAKREGIAFRVKEKSTPLTKSRPYSENFSTYRKQSWTH